MCLPHWDTILLLIFVTEDSYHYWSLSRFPKPFEAHASNNSLQQLSSLFIPHRTQYWCTGDSRFNFWPDGQLSWGIWGFLQPFLTNIRALHPFPLHNSHSSTIRNYVNIAYAVENVSRWKTRNNTGGSLKTGIKWCACQGLTHSLAVNCISVSKIGILWCLRA